MRSKDVLLSEFGELIDFLQLLKSQEIKNWHESPKKGKWAIGDIISHIVLWDEFFLKKAILNIKDGEPVAIKELKFDEFNKKAVPYGKKQKKDELLDQAIKYRKLLLKELLEIPEACYHKSYGKFVIANYLETFIEHDRHHMEQIRCWPG